MIHNNTKYLHTALFTLCILMFNQAHAAQPNLPDLGSPDLIAYDQQTEERLGDAFTTSLHEDYDLNYDPEVISYIRRIGHKIASETGNYRHFKFYVIDNPNINAFAGPNGIIGLHTGLILSVKNEDELASVIAHEIAHVTQNHLSRRYEFNATQGNLTTVATFLTALLIGMYDSNAGMATLMGGMGLNIEQQLKNSRQHEFEADAVGIELLHKAGYDPHAMADFFANLYKESRNNQYSLPEILRTHPVTEHRLAEAENRAINLHPIHNKEQSNHLALIQSRIRKAQDIQSTPNKKSALSKETACYQKTLKQIQNNNRQNRDLSQTCIYQLVEQKPEHNLYALLLLELITQTNQHPLKGLEIAQYQYAFHPNDIATLIRYSRLLIKTGKHKAAIALLKNSYQASEHPYLTFTELAEIHQNLNENAQAYLAAAIAQIGIGNHERASYLLSQAEILSQKENNELTQQIKALREKHPKLLKTKGKKINKHYP